MTALLNVVVLAGIPFPFQAVYHRRKHGRSLAQILRRAGITPGETKYLGYPQSGPTSFRV